MCALPYIYVFLSVGGKVADILLKYYLFRNDFKGDLHVFVTFHGCVIVKVINLKDEEASIGSRYGDVEQLFFL